MLINLRQSSQCLHSGSHMRILEQWRNSLTCLSVLPKFNNHRKFCTQNINREKSFSFENNLLRKNISTNYNALTYRQYHWLRQKQRQINKPSFILSGYTNCPSVHHVHTSFSLQVRRPEVNPLIKLQKDLEIPVVYDNDLPFNPTQQEIRQAEQLFIAKNHKIEFLKSAVFEEQLPEYELPEVAFVGRSNVGKSSLIRVLFHTVKDLTVKVSSKPGHTRTLNFFQVGKCFSLVDMPGYGYNMPEHFETSVESFLNSRKKLVRSFVLIDGSVGISKADLVGLDMVNEFGLPFVIVLTKIDKAKTTVLIKNLVSILEYTKKSHTCFPQPFLVSAVNGDGLALLQTFIGYVTGSVAIQGM